MQNTACIDVSQHKGHTNVTDLFFMSRYAHVFMSLCRLCEQVF